MKTKKGYWITFLSLTVIGLILTLIGVYEMYGFEVQDTHETLRDVMKDARHATRGMWIPGLILMVGAYILTYFPYKTN